MRVQSRQLVENDDREGGAEGRALRGAQVTRARVHSARENVSNSRQGVQGLYLSKLVQLLSTVPGPCAGCHLGNGGKLSNS